jgi:DNA topoisomerase III
MKIKFNNPSNITNEITSKIRVDVDECNNLSDETDQIHALALICERYFENLNFNESTYFQLELLHTKSFIEFKSQSKFRIGDEKKAKHILKSIQRYGKVEVVDIKLDRIIVEPPLLFNIIDLQIEANIKFNFTSQETLEIAQSLFEKQFISNHLTESKYLHDEIWYEIPKLVRILQEREEYKKVTNGLKWGTFNKKIVSNQKVFNQHGILITDKIPSALSVKEKVIYEMIVFRFLESISQACIKEITTIDLEVSYYKFSTQYCKIIDSGWCSIKANFIENLEIIQDFPVLKIGDELKVKQAYILENKTKPQKLYTESSLLVAIEKIGNEAVLFNASFIEKLIVKNCMIRRNNSFIPTEKGLKIIKLINQKSLKNKDIIALIDHYQETSSLSTKLYCPKCKNQQLIVTEINVECPEKTCNWTQFRTIGGVQLSISEIENLIYKGKTSLIKGFQVKSGKKFNAIIELNEHAESSFILEQKK